jgi:hypothetical protein
MLRVVTQVCGVFLVLVSAAGTGMYWGLQCYPWVCGAFIAAYTLAAVLCVILGDQFLAPLVFTWSWNVAGIHYSICHLTQAAKRAPDERKGKGSDTSSDLSPELEDGWLVKEPAKWGGSDTLGKGVLMQEGP